MDINLPLILMVAVVVTGVVWVFDLIVLTKPRKLAAAAVDEKFQNLTEADRGQDAGYLRALNNAVKEPLLVEYSKSFFPVLAVVFVLRSFILEPFKIPSESMVPTLEVGDFIVVSKFAYGLRLPVFRTKIMNISQPKRGDVVVFFPPHKDIYYIKRLVGLPGDSIRYYENKLYVNGELMPQELVESDPLTRSGNACWGGEFQVLTEIIGNKEHLMRKCSSSSLLGRVEPWTVPEGHYFMMGDNRDNSADSRSPTWTNGPFVPDKNIVGKAFGIWMHWNEGLPSFSRAGSIQ